MSDIAGVAMVVSEFVMRESAANSALVVPWGCDHVRLRAAKALVKTFKAGTVLFGNLSDKKIQWLELWQSAFKNTDVQAEICWIGGDQHPPDLPGFNIKTLENPDERWGVLDDWDFYFGVHFDSGFDFLFLEAQARGLLGVGFDVGAYPELTPFVFDNPSQAGVFLQTCLRNQSFYDRQSEMGRRFVRRKFRWKDSVRNFEIATGLRGNTTSQWLLLGASSAGILSRALRKITRHFLR